MARELAWHQQHGIEAQIQSGEIGVTLQEVLCRAPDAALLARPDRLAGGDQGVPVLHLDDGQDAAAAGDQVDLADRAAETLGQHTVALEAQPPGGDAFPPPAPRVGAPARRRGHDSPLPSFLASRSEEHTSELQSLMRISYAVFCLKKKKQAQQTSNHTTH